MQTYELLEQEIGKWVGYDPANVVVCSSGSAALHLSFEALQLPPVSKVLCPDFTIIACARAVTLAGHVPIFVDCDDRLLMDLELIKPHLGRDTRSLLVVHIYGRKLDVSPLFHPGIPNPLIVVEDMAEVHGVKPHQRTDAACYSFYSNKVVCGQEGGAVAFKDRSKADLARMLRSLGFTPEHDFWHVPRGMNYRLSNANAQLILDSLHLVNTNIAERRVIERWYDKACPTEWKMPPRDVPWVYDLRIPGLTSEKQSEIVKALNFQGMPARHAFKPLRRQPEYTSNEIRDKRRTFWDKPLVEETNADRVAREVFYCPLTPGLVTEEMVEKSFRIVRQTCG